MDVDLNAGAPGGPRFQVALFVTCLADLFRPSVAFDSITLLELAGCEVTVPQAQTCCGQPGYNSGDYESTIPLAKALIETFALIYINAQTLRVYFLLIPLKM